MKAQISTHPPLGLVSQISHKSTHFTALFEVDNSITATNSWQVVLWHSYYDMKEWIETPMILLQDTPTQPIYFHSSKPQKGLVHLLFKSQVAVHLPTNFTIKFRTGLDQSWKWVREHQGTMDGVVIFKPPLTEITFSNDLADYFHTLSPYLTWKKWPSQNPGTILWSIEMPIESRKENNPTVKKIKIGKPWGQNMISRWMALTRIWSPWLAPRQGKTRFNLDKEAVICSFLSLHGKHLVLLPISDANCVMTIFTNNDDGDVYLRIRNYDTEIKDSRLLVGVSNDFESANAEVMSHAITSVSSTQNCSGAQQNKFNKLSKLSENDGAPEVSPLNWYDGLTYCTWNSLGQNLTEDKVIEAVAELATNKINVTNFIIDDNWQSTSSLGGSSPLLSGLVEFEASREAFPNGLKHIVSLIREKLPSIQHVAVWHTIHGYWGGIAPDGQLAQNYKTMEILRENSDGEALKLGEKMTIITKEDIAKFYDDFYRFLSACGVTAVKTDAKFVLETFAPKAHRLLLPAYLDAWTTSNIRYFNSRSISCMSQNPQTLFHLQISPKTPLILARNSDDFFPEVDASHPWHIFCNAHNALFTQHLNVIPDWDMFQTLHQYSGFHAAARCMSGGPVCITDVPGQHNLEIMNQITGQTPGGQTIIFRLSAAGKSLDPYMSFDDEGLLLIGGNHGTIIPKTGLIGFFNLKPHRIGKLFPISTFPGILETHQYVIRAFLSGFVSRPLNVNKDVLIFTCLNAFGYDILSAYPLTTCVVEDDEEILIANLGLLDKMTGAAAITSSKITKLKAGKIDITTSLKALGLLGLYISTLNITLSCDQITVTLCEKMVPGFTITTSQVDEHVLVIDTFGAWKAMELKSDSSEEVVVECILESSSK